MNLKATAEKMMNIEGNVRGEMIRTIFGYIKQQKGEEGIRAVEEELEKLGYPLKNDEIRPLEWYKEAHCVIIYLICMEIFDWKESDIFDMGKNTLKSSLLLSILMKQFLSIERVFQESPKYWSKNMDFGELIPVRISEKDKIAIIRVRGYEFHPVAEQHIAGYFLGMAILCVKNHKDMKIDITKSVHDGNDYSEYQITWR